MAEMLADGTAEMTGLMRVDTLAVETAGGMASWLVGQSVVMKAAMMVALMVLKLESVKEES